MFVGTQKKSKPIVALVSTKSISQRQFDELLISYFNDGTYYGGTKEDFLDLDLFFADDENTNKILDELKSYFEKTPKEQVEKDWKEIQDWYARHFTNEKHNEEDELTEFEKEVDAIIDENIKRNIGLKYEARNLINLARKELEKNYYTKVLDDRIVFKSELHSTDLQTAYDMGKQDALKNLPKWKKSNSFFNTGNKFELGKTSLRRFDGYEILYSELEKLQKEE